MDEVTQHESITRVMNMDEVTQHESITSIQRIYIRRGEINTNANIIKRSYSE
jgi:hypothetical protein